MTRLALYSHTSVDAWADVDPAYVLTALALIDEDERARRREETRAYARSRR